MKASLSDKEFVAVDTDTEYSIEFSDNSIRKFSSLIATCLENKIPMKLFNIEKEGKKLKFTKTSFMKKGANDSSSPFKPASVNSSPTLFIKDLIDAKTGNCFGSFVVKVLAVNDKQIKNQSMKEIIIGDQTGVTSISIWPESLTEVAQIEVGQVLRMKNVKISSYRMIMPNGPKTLTYINKKTKMTPIEELDVLRSLENIEYENPQRTIKGNIVEVMDTNTYSSCPKCRHRIDLDWMKTCSNDKCFWQVKESESNKDYRTTLVCFDSQDYHYVTCFRSNLKSFEIENVEQNQNEDADDFVKRCLEKIMKSEVSITYKKKEAFDGTFVKMEVLPENQS